MPSILSARSHASSIRIKDNSIWISGGLGDKGSLSSTEILHRGGMFQQSTELPEPMAYHCTAQINKTHLFIAGNVYDSHLQAYIVDTTNTSAFHFTKLPEMLNPRWGCACTVIRTPEKLLGKENVKLMVVGGDFPAYKSSELYSFTTQSWTVGPELPRGFYFGGYTKTPDIDAFILIGGWDGSRYRTDLLVYNEEEGIFEVLNGNLAIGRSRFGTVVVDKEEFCS